ncbi:MAG: hypothetical protein JWM93_3512, partial [Frankiales bacterium]|nr:hypothetical protein [Frankiales bacterium]
MDSRPVSAPDVTVEKDTRTRQDRDGYDASHMSDTDLPVILLSHRAPVTFGRDDSGERTVSRGA